jgi:hypothetical protein
MRAVLAADEFSHTSPSAHSARMPELIGHQLETLKSATWGEPQQSASLDVIQMYESAASRYDGELARHRPFLHFGYTVGGSATRYTRRGTMKKSALDARLIHESSGVSISWYGPEPYPGLRQIGRRNGASYAKAILSG